MSRKRKTGDKPYRFNQHKDRPIEVVFDFIPGKRISTGTYNLIEAAEWAERFLEDGGAFTRKKIPTLAEYAKGFFKREDKDSEKARDRLYGRNFNTSHYLQSQALLDNYILPKFGAYLVTAITAKAIEQWLPYLKSARSQEDLSSDTKNKVLTAFRAILDRVKKDGYRSDNPAEEVRMLTVRGKEREALSPKALLTLFPSDPEQRIKVWGSAMWALYFSILYDTGLRPGECAALRVSDIWQTSKGLSVATSRSVNANERKIKDSVKTSGKGYSERTGLLYDDTAELLIKYISAEGLTGDDMLFTSSRKDKIIIPETANKHFKETLKRHGLYKEGLVQYCLRHTYATERRGDLSDDVLALSMGHTKLRSDYDHQKASDLIRRLEDEREALFKSRGRHERESEIKKFKP